MNKNILITIIILLVIVGGALIWHFWPEEDPIVSEEEGEVEKDEEEKKDIDEAEVEIIKEEPPREGGCPGRTEATMKVDYTLSRDVRYFPDATGEKCVYIEIMPGCAPESPHDLFISNENCDDNLIYIAGDGKRHKLVPKDDPESKWTNTEGKEYSHREITIPQEIGVGWEREFYFESYPEDKITIFAENVSRE